MSKFADKLNADNICLELEKMLYKIKELKEYMYQDTLDTTTTITEIDRESCFEVACFQYKEILIRRQTKAANLTKILRGI